MGRRLQTLKESDIKFDRNFHSCTHTIVLSSLRVSLQSVSNSAASQKKIRPSAIRPYLLIVERIVDGVAQSRDEVGLRYQRHTLLNQKLCLVTKQTRREESKAKRKQEENQRLDSKFLSEEIQSTSNAHTEEQASPSPLQR